MKEVILIIVVLCMFVFGYFVMGNLDKFLAENRRCIEKESEKREPSFVMLTDNMTEEEIMEEVCSFCKSHRGENMILFCNEDMENIESEDEIKDRQNFWNMLE